MKINTNATEAAHEIARAHPFSQAYNNTWIHYCEYCRYANTKAKGEWHYTPGKARGTRIILINGEWYRVPQVTRQLKKIFK